MIGYILFLLVIICFIVLAIYIKQTKRDIQQIKDSEKIMIESNIRVLNSTNDKPALFILAPSQLNARWWQSFASRNMLSKPNIPFFYGTILSYLVHNHTLYDVCVISNDNVKIYLPDIDEYIVSSWAYEEKSYLTVCLELLMKYKGTCVPVQSICIEPLHKWIQPGINAVHQHDLFSAVISYNTSIENILESTKESLDIQHLKDTICHTTNNSAIQYIDWHDCLDAKYDTEKACMILPSNPPPRQLGWIYRLPLSKILTYDNCIAKILKKSIQNIDISKNVIEEMENENLETLSS